ncbi:CLUMA_CG021043, isoform A [Clunio marinus]|uniref:CLUMA_CG021043, isoform A n=1 Tax=Clunio marinus TaxID=568069 RepID=A0A1J1J6K5_9DIPT|nr:CLUMA_CG021043, isoform A [Clunio marinus]
MDVDFQLQLIVLIDRSEAYNPQCREFLELLKGTYTGAQLKSGHSHHKSHCFSQNSDISSNSYELN